MRKVKATIFLVAVTWGFSALTSGSALLLAQTAGTGALSGTVSDSTGAVIPKATVILVSPQTGAARAVATDQNGSYRFSLLPPGTYQVEFAATGFRTHAVANLVIAITETQTFNVVLEIGDVDQRVDVVAVAPLVQSETATLGHVVSNRTITALPLTTRNYTQTLGLAAGVVSDVPNAGELGRNSQDVYASGMRNIDNNYQMDGISINNFGTGTAGEWLGYAGIPIPNPDALQEFKVQTSLYDASYGRNAGANVNVLTKSGTNALHGSLFHFLRNEALNANDYFIKRTGGSKPVLRQNQFGGTSGGPIVKDKLFFFASYQGTRQLNGLGSSSNRTSFLPPLTEDRSAATLGAQFCGQAGASGGVAVACDGSNINPVAIRLLNAKLPDGTFFIPTPQVMQESGLGFSAFSLPSKFVEDQYLLNLDYAVTDRHRLAARYFHADAPMDFQFTDSNVPGSGATKDFRNQVLSTKVTSVLSNSLVNDASFGYTRNYGRAVTKTPITSAELGMTPAADQELMPLLIVQGLFQTGGNYNDDMVTNNESFQFGNNISWFRGRHNVRAGFSYERLVFDFQLPGPKRGTAIFQSFPDFLLGMSAAENGSQFSNIFGSNSFAGELFKNFRLNNYSTFVQDDFRLHQRLTLNLGLRWEIFGQFMTTDGKFAIVWPHLAGEAPPESGTLAGFTVPPGFPEDQFPVPEGLGVLRRNTKGPTARDYPLTNWGPRIGFSWQPLPGIDRIVLRAGYGVFHTRTQGNLGLTSSIAAPFAGSESRRGVDNASATFAVPFNPPPSASGWDGVVRTPTTLRSGAAWDPNYNTPLTQHFSFNVQYELVRDLLLEAGYVGTRGTRISRTRNINQPILASPENPVNGITENTVGNARLRAPMIGWGSFSIRETNGSSQYDSLQTTVRKRLSRGFQFQAAHTWSKALSDTLGAGFNSVFGGGTGNFGDVTDPRKRWGPTDFDRRHRFVLSYVWEMPRFANETGFLGKLLNGWGLSGVTTFQTGKSLTLLDQRAGSIWAFVGGQFGGASSATLCPGFTIKDIPTPGPVHNRLDGFFNSAAFCPPPIIGNGTDYGTLGRGIVRGPDQRNFDIALTKTIKVGGFNENAVLQFRAEFFNVFNTLQFADPGVGRVGAEGGAGLNVAFADFGKISALAVPPRLIQFGLKYIF